ncbi:replication initiator protein [Asterias forbesi associated circular virus]|nr:replication initiator protein [Asterias forbesi associated circular virus]
MKSRNWIFTINNELIWKPENHLIKFVVYQLEEGEKEKVPHIQGYLELKQPRALSWMKKLNSKAHWEIRKGNRVQALQYVTKEETRMDAPWILNCGQWSQYDASTWTRVEDWLNTVIPGVWKDGSKSTKSIRLSEIKSKLDDGCSSEVIADNYFEDWVRHYRAFEKYLLIKSKPRDYPVRVVVVIGPTGTGKSRFCMEQYPDAYWKQRSQWWDGYVRHKTIILDEYYGWLPFDLLLRLCDRYPLMLETKGGQCNCEANTIVITSNNRPDSWYKNCYFPAFERRVDTFIIMKELGSSFIFKKWSDAEKHTDPLILN